MDALDELIRRVVDGQGVRKKLRIRAREVLTERLYNHRPKLISIVQKLMWPVRFYVPHETGIEDDVADEAIEKVYRMAFDQLGPEVGLEVNPFNTKKQFSKRQTIESLAEIITREVAQNIFNGWKKKIQLAEQEQVLNCRSIDDEFRIDVIKSIEVLGEYEGCLIRMRYFEGRRINDIATKLHKSTETVRRDLRKTEGRLKVMLTDNAA